MAKVELRVADEAEATERPGSMGQGSGSRALIGYARVSTAEGAQVLDRQLDALRAVGCERELEDRASGAKADRSGLARCLDHLRLGDVLVVLDLRPAPRQGSIRRKAKLTRREGR